VITGVARTAIPLQTDRGWHPLNPSVAVDGDGFRAIVRTVNYEKYDGGYAIHDGTSTRTVNYLATFDRRLEMTGCSQIVDPDTAPRSTLVLGFEDCRLVEWEGGWWATATARHLRWDAVCEIALLRLEGSAIADVRVMHGPDPARHEKNWMPFVHGGALHIVYGFAPFVVYRWDAAAGRLDEVRRVATPPSTAHFRGGSQGVRVEGGYLFLVHESKLTLGLQVYDHRLVLIDDDLQPVAASDLFTFTTDNIEYCAGAARRGDDLVMSIGLEDREAALVTAPLDALLSLLRPLAELEPAGLSEPRFSSAETPSPRTGVESPHTVG
jgi:predicted GH43/DUF377 family glycosyl hydrolase